jgi:DNA-binding transcriptional LysR family regulator
MDRSDLQLVLTIREQGSLAGAARALHLAPPAITKRLAALEARLKLRLFQRSTRRLSATADGDALCEHAKRLLQGFRDAEAELLERQAEPSGLIRIAATFGFGRLWVGPAVSDFQARYPRLQVQLQLTERLPDLNQDGFDGAVWLWSLPHNLAADWVSKRLARNQRVLVASPAYIQARGQPKTPQELADHDCLIVRENVSDPAMRHDLWVLQPALGKGRTPMRLHVGGALSSNSGELVRDWCLAGRGIMLRSLWDIAPQLARGELVQVLPQFMMADADIHWLMPWHVKTPKRLRLLIDFLEDRFKSQPWRPATKAQLAEPPDQHHKR